MVTSISNTPTYSTEHDVFVENSRVAIEQPLICVDGYILACRFDGERCTPTFAISTADLLNAVKTELVTQSQKEKFPSLSESPPQSPSSKITMGRSSPTLPHPLSRRKLFRQSSRDNNNSGIKRYSDDLTGVSYDHIENTYRNSFILPTRDNNKKPNSKTGRMDVTTTDLNDNVINDVDTKKQSELEPQIQWVQENCSDYVNTETVHSCAQLNTLLNILMKMSSATMVTMKIVGSTEINVTYQFMDQFKQDYMVVKINPGYAMLMKTF